MSSQLAREAAIKLAPIFNMFGWEWSDGVPGEPRIARAIDSLLQSLDDPDTISVSSGRISVFKDEEGTIEVKLDIKTLDKYGQLY